MTYAEILTKQDQPNLQIERLEGVNIGSGGCLNYCPKETDHGCSATLNRVTPEVVYI